MAHTEHEIMQFLARVPLFRGLKEKQLKTLTHRMKEIEYKAGDTIVEQATMGVGLFIIGRGTAEVIRLHGDGSRIVIDTLEVYDFFGELSLLDEAPRAASVIARTEMICLVLSKLDLMDELRSDAEIGIEMLKTLAHRFRQMLVKM